jgi:hypothetical protein
MNPDRIFVYVIAWKTIVYIYKREDGVAVELI